MSTTYTHSNDTGNLASKGSLALFVTAAIFSLLPILQILPNFWTGGLDPNLIKTAQDTAPVVIEPVPDEPLVKEKLEKPKLEQPKPRLTIHEL
jgi:hypothetical protein